MHNILLLKGGGSNEHDISLISAKYIKSQIDLTQYSIYEVEIAKNGHWYFEEEPCELLFGGGLKTNHKIHQIHAAIPCLHGYPGETGDIQGLLNLFQIPYLGCGSEASIMCFNKMTTKLILENMGLKTTPFIQLNPLSELTGAHRFLEEHKNIFIKASNQGSSVGCYQLEIDQKDELEKTIKEAFQYSNLVLLEKTIQGRELELAAFEHNGQIHLTKPGEIIVDSKFYDYESKYSETSTAKTVVEASNISRPILGEFFRQAQIAYDALQIRHLARIDFFLSNEDEVFINEVNTFPGHTPISMFPMMMENYGVKYSDFINQSLYRLVQD